VADDDGFRDEASDTEQYAGDDDARYDDAYEYDEYDEYADDDYLDDAAPPSPIRRFEASAAGVVAAGFMTGLQNALFGKPKEEVQVVADWSGDPPFTDPYVLRLDPDHPEDSIVMVRPWLRDAEASDTSPAPHDRDDHPPRD
jgi:hypothetical protein